MGVLRIGNQYSEGMVGDLDRVSRQTRRAGGNTATRMVWALRPGDVLVLPRAPEPEFWSYATSLTGVASDSFTVLVPPPGRFGADVLSADRLTDPGLVAELTGLSEGIGAIQPFFFDSSLARLARHMGLTDRVPGLSFVAQGGTGLLNSKAVFRAVAAGIGVPIADGVVTTRPAEAASMTAALLSAGRHAIVKQDFHVGALGNAILTAAEGLRPVGAATVTVLGSPREIEVHVDRNWAGYSGSGRNPVVVEEYVADSTPIYVELAVTDDHVEPLNHGEMRMTPVFDGFAIPGRETRGSQRAMFIAISTTLCEVVQRLGYRGLINVDGIVTPAGEVLLTEFNGRLGGSTHLHEIGTRLIGPDYDRTHLLATRNHWHVPSFTAARDRLADLGIAFDRHTRAGALITCDNTRHGDTVEYCVAARSPDEADAFEKLMNEAF